MTTSDSPSEATTRPFGWLLKPRQLAAPTGALAELLRHEYAPVLSRALQGGFELIYGPPERQSKRRWFLSECGRDDRVAIDRLHEILVLTVLSSERWLCLDAEPNLGGDTHPEFLMAPPPYRQSVLVEVKTVHRAKALMPCDETRRALEDYLKEKLRRSGYTCASLRLHALPGQVPEADEYDASAEAVLRHARRSLLKPRGYFEIDLATGATVDLLLADAGFRGPLADRRRKIEEAKASVNRSFHETSRFFDERRALEASYRHKIRTRIGKAAGQIERAGAALPAIVAIATSDHDWSVREAYNAAREDLKSRQANRPSPAALLLVSFFQKKPVPLAETPDWVNAAQLERWRETLVLGAHAACVKLNRTAPAVSHLYVYDPAVSKAVIHTPALTMPAKAVSAPGERSGWSGRKKRR